jgi:TPR repeat protein
MFDSHRALTNLSIMYADGVGIPRNDVKSFALLRQAAEKGHARAQCRLADFMLEGRGCNSDTEGAVEWYKTAAAQGSVTALASLGRCAETGTGCEVDLDRAIGFYERAAAMGDTTSSQRLVVLVANPALVQGLFMHGCAAPAA